MSENKPLSKLYPQLLGKVKSIPQLMHMMMCKKGTKIFLENGCRFSIPKLKNIPTFAPVFIQHLFCIILILKYNAINCTIAAFSQFSEPGKGY